MAETEKATVDEKTSRTARSDESRAPRSIVAAAATPEAEDDESPPDREKQISRELMALGYSKGAVSDLIVEARAAVKERGGNEAAADDVYRAAFERKRAESM